jgi:hypothetical protein
MVLSDGMNVLQGAPSALGLEERTRIIFATRGRGKVHIYREEEEAYV